MSYLKLGVRGLIPALTMWSALLSPGSVFAQGSGGAPPSAKAAAPVDLTGYWVAVISEDWRWRMVTPAKGDYASIPLTKAGKRAADTWDPKKDEATGEQCRSYAAPGLMRLPIRLHITWQDDNTLKLETDLGMQTRLFQFGNWKAPGGPPGWQGDSVASWDMPHGPGSAPPRSMTVVTKNMRPGYMRKNGVPFSGGAVLTEYFDLAKESNGDQWIIDTMVLDDPLNLQIPWTTPIQYKKEPNGSKWDTTPCSATW
ncbi:MAG: hypothetical protein M3O20_00715 [Acidobacteriota bacterium]|nr:hypothetical protein [Acidobacteriota bacterium]